MTSASEDKYHNKRRVRGSLTLAYHGSPMQATEAEVEVDTGTMPETRPGLHVTKEGRLVGHAEVNVEWSGPGDGAAGPATIDEIREASEELRAKGKDLPDVWEVDEETHKALKAEADAKARLPPNGVDGSPGAPGVPSHPNARCGTMEVEGVPVVQTAVGAGGRKSTTSGSVDLNIDGDVTDVDVEEVARKVAEEARRASMGRTPGGRR